MPFLQVHLLGPMDIRHGDQQLCEPPTLTVDATNQSAQWNSKGNRSDGVSFMAVNGKHW